MEGRFASPVYPGEDLTIEVWRLGAGECVFQTRCQDGRVVFDGGRHIFDE
jgi:acyl dehydratase